jgi:thiamine-phosphate pyrophosphorylase
LQRQLLVSRNSGGDVAAFAEAPAEGVRGNAAAIATANARRAQESLRVLEEVAKLYPQTSALDWKRFRHARFDLYKLEQDLVLRLLRQEKAGKMSGLYVLIDTQALKGRSEVEVARGAIRGGATVIQLRDKQRNKRELLPIAQGLKALCASSGIPFLINDHLDLALAADADGLHLGQGDLPFSEARRLLPQDKLLGCSAATLEEAIKAESDGADYIAVGSIYKTTSKSDFRLAGVETLHQVKEAVSIPVVAIGGIDEDNLAEVIVAGADAVAVIGAVLGAEDIEMAARRLRAKMESCTTAAR